MQQQAAIVQRQQAVHTAVDRIFFCLALILFVEGLTLFIFQR